MASDSISYLADDMFYDVLSSTANLFGDVQITSGNSILRSDTITIDLKRNIMTSHGTTYIKDKANCMIGYDVWVNPKKEWTLFLQGSGKLEVGYYYGSQIRDGVARHRDVHRRAYRRHLLAGQQESRLSRGGLRQGRLPNPENYQKASEQFSHLKNFNLEIFGRMRLHIDKKRVNPFGAGDYLLIKS